MGAALGEPQLISKLSNTAGTSPIAQLHQHVNRLIYRCQLFHNIEYTIVLWNIITVHQGVHKPIAASHEMSGHSHEAATYRMRP